MHNNENQVFEFENATYLTEFDESYNPNEDPDFQNMDVDTDDTSDGGSDLAEAAHEDTRVCFRGRELSIVPCDHKCCEVWRLHPRKPTEMKFSTFRSAWHKPAGLRRGGKAFKSTHKKGGKRLMGGKGHGLQKKNGFLSWFSTKKSSKINICLRSTLSAGNFVQSCLLYTSPSPRDRG